MRVILSQATVPPTYQNHLIHDTIEKLDTSVIDDQEE